MRLDCEGAMASLSHARVGISTTAETGVSKLQQQAYCTSMRLRSTPLR